jgi:hypothetical protein
MLVSRVLLKFGVLALRLNLVCHVAVEFVVESLRLIPWTLQLCANELWMCLFLALEENLSIVNQSLQLGHSDSW